MKMSMRAARVNARLTQKQAAKKIGVSCDTVGLWERGKSYPSTKHIPKIEETYGVKYDDISFLTTA